MITAILSGQIQSPMRFNLASDQDTLKSTGLKSNIIAELKLMGDSLTWLGTGQGLALHNGKQIFSFLSTQDSLADQEFISLLPAGGIPAIAVKGDTLAVSFSGDNGSIQLGKGLALSYSAQDTNNLSWRYFKQPVDLPSDTVRPFGEGYYKC